MGEFVGSGLGEMPWKSRGTGQVLIAGSLLGIKPSREYVRTGVIDIFMMVPILIASTSNECAGG